jgi:hypothetical protein
MAVFRVINRYVGNLAPMPGTSSVPCARFVSRT